MTDVEFKEKLKIDLKLNQVAKGLYVTADLEWLIIQEYSQDDYAFHWIVKRNPGNAGDWATWSNKPSRQSAVAAIKKDCLMVGLEKIRCDNIIMNPIGFIDRNEMKLVNGKENLLRNFVVLFGQVEQYGYSNGNGKNYLKYEFKKCDIDFYVDELGGEVKDIVYDNDILQNYEYEKMSDDKLVSAMFCVTDRYYYIWNCCVRHQHAVLGR